MSEKQEKRKRFEQRVSYMRQLRAWLQAEPPMWKIFAWHRWKKNRPIVMGVADLVAKEEEKCS